MVNISAGRNGFTSTMVVECSEARYIGEEIRVGPFLLLPWPLPFVVAAVRAATRDVADAAVTRSIVQTQDAYDVALCVPVACLRIIGCFAICCL